MKIITFGRSAENNIRVNKAQISRTHARLIQTEWGWEIEDTHSQNGTFLNGNRLVSGKRYPLDGNDKLELASYEIDFSPFLSLPEQITIGREMGNTIRLNYPFVSGYHAKVEMLPGGKMRITDLDSRNGVYVNKKEVQSGIVEMDDSVHVGSLLLPTTRLLEAFGEPLSEPSDQGRKSGPFPESNKIEIDIASSAQISRIPPKMLPTKSRLNLSDFFPFWQRKDLLLKPAYLWPGIMGVLLLGMLIFNLSEFIRQGESSTEIFVLRFTILLGIGITLGSLALIYRICGQSKALWMFPLLIGLSAFGLAPDWPYRFYLIFSEPCLFPNSCSIPGYTVSSLFINPPFSPIMETLLGGVRGWIDPMWSGGNVLQRFLYHFLEVGLPEELYKIFPVLILAGVTGYLPNKLRERIGINEPLDGILWAAACAVGFILVETFLQYVLTPLINSPDSSANGWLLVMQIGVVRSMDSITGHIAFSGYFGYFIGKARMQPRFVWLLFPCGYISASLLHALHNTVQTYWGQLTISFVVYLLLIGAIVNARKVSPRRSQNFATGISSLNI